jgi:hypothetical protein
MDAATVMAGRFCNAEAESKSARSWQGHQPYPVQPRRSPLPVLDPTRFFYDVEDALQKTLLRAWRYFKYWQLSNCHCHALREWHLALKRANLCRSTHQKR